MDTGAVNFGENDFFITVKTSINYQPSLVPPEVGKLAAYVQKKTTVGT